MFLRKKKNRSRNTSIVVVDKSHGKFRQLRTIGVSSDGEELERLLAKGREWILEHSGKVDIFKDHHREQEENLVTDQLLSNIENILLNGSELLINSVYDHVGFNGLALAIVKSKDSVPGTIRLRADAKGLEGVSVRLESGQ